MEHPLQPISSVLNVGGAFSFEHEKVQQLLQGHLVRILGGDISNSLPEAIGVSVAREIARLSLSKCGFDYIFELDVDDLKWSRLWLKNWRSGTDEVPRELRCDRLYLGLKPDRSATPHAGEAALLFESKGGYEGVDGVEELSPEFEPWRKATQQLG